MKTLGYFLMVCLFALFVIPQNEQQKPPVTQQVSQQLAEIRLQASIQSQKLDSLKKLDTLIDKIERNNRYLKHNQKD